MKVTQISVFMENKNGRLAEITRLLASKNISLRAVTIADTADFGILRLIVNDPDRTRDVLLEAGFTAREYGLFKKLLRYKIYLAWEIEKRELEVPDLGL